MVSTTNEYTSADCPPVAPWPSSWGERFRNCLPPLAYIPVSHMRRRMIYLQPSRPCIRVTHLTPLEDLVKTHKHGEAGFPPSSSMETSTLRFILATARRSSVKALEQVHSMPPIARALRLRPWSAALAEHRA